MFQSVDKSLPGIIISSGGGALCERTISRRMTEGNLRCDVAVICSKERKCPRKLLITINHRDTRVTNSQRRGIVLVLPQFLNAPLGKRLVDVTRNTRTKLLLESTQFSGLNGFLSQIYTGPAFFSNSFLYFSIFNQFLFIIYKKDISEITQNYKSQLVLEMIKNNQLLARERSLLSSLRLPGAKW